MTHKTKNRTMKRCKRVKLLQFAIEINTQTATTDLYKK